MSTKKKRDPDQTSEKDANKGKTELDKELDQTFPASDPPSHTRPGHDRDKDDDK